VRRKERGSNTEVFFLEGGKEEKKKEAPAFPYHSTDNHAGVKRLKGPFGPQSGGEKGKKRMFASNVRLKRKTEGAIMKKANCP